MTTLPTRKEFISNLIRANNPDMAELLAEFDLDKAKEDKGLTKSAIASREYFEAKAELDNRCTCGELIATGSKTCRKCIDNGALNTGKWMSETTRRVPKSDVMTKGRYYQGGLVSPR